MDVATSKRVAQQLVKLHRSTACQFPSLPLDQLASESKFGLPQAASPLPHDWHFALDRRSGKESGKLAFSTVWNQTSARGPDMRHLSKLVWSSNGGKKVMFVDTLALVRRLESEGLTANQAEAITASVIEVLNDSVENTAQSFVSKVEMQKSEMMQEAVLAKFKGDLQSLQVTKVSSLHRESERLRTDIERLCSEMRYEMDKVTAGQQLNLNLERGRMREELTGQNAETSNLTNKLDMEIHGLKTQVEAAKYEVIKYCIGTIVSVTAVGLGLLRILL